MKNKKLKWVFKIVINFALVIILSTTLTYVIGYFLEAEKGTIAMVLSMGFIIILPSAIINLFFLIPTIFVEEKLAKIAFVYFPVAFSFLFTSYLNLAWSSSALLFALLIANSLWFYWLIKDITPPLP